MDQGIPKSMVKRLAAVVASPNAVCASAPPHPLGMVVLTFEATGLGRVMLSVAGSQSVGRSHHLNLVTSVYVKEDERAFARWETTACCCGEQKKQARNKEKIPATSTTVWLQLPGVGRMPWEHLVF